MAVIRSLLGTFFALIYGASQYDPDITLPTKLIENMTRLTVTLDESSDSCCSEVSADREFNEWKWDIEAFNFHKKDARLEDAHIEVLGSMVIENASPKQQQSTFSASEMMESTSKYMHTAGIEVAIGMKFTAGIPILAQSSASLSIGGSYAHEWGTEKKISKQHSSTFVCTADPKQQIQCDVAVTKAKLIVPFDVILKRRGNPKCICGTRGDWTGITFFNTSLIVTDAKPCNRLITYLEPLPTAPSNTSTPASYPVVVSEGLIQRVEEQIDEDDVENVLHIKKRKCSA
jgi:hypothetical protein